MEQDVNMDAIIEEVRKFNFLVNYDVKNPSQFVKEYKRTRSNILTEGYIRADAFVQSIKSDEVSLKDNNNAIKRTYLRFAAKQPQKWMLINPSEYHAALYECTIEPWASATVTEEKWQPKVEDWEDMIKFNIQQFISNSILNRGPSFDETEETRDGKNIHAQLRYHLTGDEEITYHENYFWFTYVNPFRKYIHTQYGNNSSSTETDSWTLVYAFIDYIKEFDKNHFDFRKNLVTINKIINIAHDRGPLASIFVNGGSDALDKIAGYKKDRTNRGKESMDPDEYDDKYHNPNKGHELFQR
jgi:hypothetical protein